MVIRKYDKENKFWAHFNTVTGTYIRSGVIDENKKDTGIDPFMTCFPELIDIGIMGHCSHGLSGKCKESGIQCYQHGDICRNANMTLSDYKLIMEECAGKTFQVALGGCGDPDMHPDFEEILACTRSANIVPNFTTSGFGMTPEKAALCKKYCGAVAVSMYSRLADTVPELALRRVHIKKNRKVYKSEHDIPVKFTLGNIDPNCAWEGPDYIINGLSYAWDELHHMYYSSEPQEYEFYRVFNEKVDEGNYTMNTIKMLLDAGVTTNIHFVLSNDTIDEALIRLKYNGFPKGINAVIFLLHKPVGLGDEAQVLSMSDPRVIEFFRLVDKNNYEFKIGFDSCTVPGILNMAQSIDRHSLDTCEAARWSMYITPDMKGLPCSFDNQNMMYAVDIKEAGGIKSVWDSDKFNQIRDKFKTRCKGCMNQRDCMGGCPLMDGITLCNKPERSF